MLPSFFILSVNLLTFSEATNAIATIIKGLNRANRVVENRNFFEVRLLALVMVIVNAFLLLNLYSGKQVLLNEF